MGNRPIYIKLELFWGVSARTSVGIEVLEIAWAPSNGTTTPLMAILLIFMVTLVYLPSPRDPFSPKLGNLGGYLLIGKERADGFVVLSIFYKLLKFREGDWEV